MVQVTALEVGVKAIPEMGQVLFQELTAIARVEYTFWSQWCIYAMAEIFYNLKPVQSNPYKVCLVSRVTGCASGLAATVRVDCICRYDSFDGDILLYAQSAVVYLAICLVSKGIRYIRDEYMYCLSCERCGFGENVLDFHYQTWIMSMRCVLELLWCQ